MTNSRQSDAATRKRQASRGPSPPTDSSSTQNSSPTARKKARQQEDINLQITMVLPCMCCGDDVGLAQGHLCVSQRHLWCTVCISDYYTTRVHTSEEFFHLGCCGAPVTPDLSFLPEDMVGKVSLKLEESETENKTYCADKRCSAFISTKDLEKEAKSATCSSCGKETCLFCKRAAHKGTCSTEQDSDEAMLHKLAEEQG